MRPEVVLGLILLDVGAILLIVYLYLRVQAKKRATSYTPLAERLQAKLMVFPSEPGMVGLRWERRDVRYLLKFGRGRVELRAKSRGQALSRLRLRWELEEGTPFRIRVTEQEGGKPADLLSERFWVNLEMIARMGRPSGGSLEVLPDEAVLRKPLGLEDDDALQLFVRLGLPVLTRAIKVCAMAGIEILESAPTGEGDCPVCSHPLSGQTVRCAKCRTPHHQDCWEYLGACATYACGGREGRG